MFELNTLAYLRIIIHAKFPACADTSRVLRVYGFRPSPKLQKYAVAPLVDIPWRPQNSREHAEGPCLVCLRFESFRMYSHGFSVAYWLDSTHVEPHRSSTRRHRPAIIFDAFAPSPPISICCPGMCKGQGRADHSAPLKEAPTALLHHSAVQLLRKSPVPRFRGAKAF